MTHLFLSDVHLGGHTSTREKAVEKALMSLIRHAALHRIRMHVLGDLFDYWMEYPGWNPSLGSNVLDSFRDYHQTTGFRTTYVTGNHDNWTRGYFSSLGFDVQGEYKRLELDGRNIFMHHGDGLADPAFGYPRPFFHRVLRHPWFVRIYQTMFPPETGLDIMRRFSARKGKRLQFKGQGLKKWSRQVLSGTGADGEKLADVMINGHVHRADMAVFDFGLMIQLPAFPSFGKSDRFRLLSYTKGTFSFVEWDEDLGELRSFPEVDCSDEGLDGGLRDGLREGLDGGLRDGLDGGLRDGLRVRYPLVSAALAGEKNEPVRTTKFSTTYE